MSKCAYCRQCIIADIQPQVIIDDEFLVHQHCVPKINKEVKKKGAKVLKRLMSAAAIFLLVFTLGIKADEPIHGCYVTYLSQSGKFLYEPFVKLGDKEYTDENGEAEIWGVGPWSESSKKDGKLVPVNVTASRFVPRGKAQKVPAGTTYRMVKCPDGF